jgi:hypothetical protein
MKKLILLVLFVLPMTVQSQELSDSTSTNIKIVKSPVNRVAVLELYTSEGCSSCPPADRFLSELEKTGISSKKIIPMAFHVTYWDYIGWQDRYAKKQYDQRQRDMARKQSSNSVYTPQFLLSGDDYRRYSSFSKDVNKIIMEKSSVDIELSLQDLPAKADVSRLLLNLKSNSSEKNLSFYFAVVENNLSSDVEAGENNGEQLHHDYVVRKLYGPFHRGSTDKRYEIEQAIALDSEWAKSNLSFVAFAENLQTGEVLQAVSLQY